MGSTIAFYISGSLMRMYSAAYVLPTEVAIEALVEEVINSISTSVIVECGGVTMHLAAWQDPEHWGDEWRAKGIDPELVPALVAAQVAEANDNG